MSYYLYRMEAVHNIRRNGDGALLAGMRTIDGTSEWHRAPLYAVVHLRSGSAVLETGRTTFSLQAPVLLFFTPYQEYAFHGAFSGSHLSFHGDFYCIEKHRHEVACNGVLFNNIYTPPFVPLDEEQAAQAAKYLELLQAAMSGRDDLGREDLVIAHLKILLIIATRVKSRQIAETLTQLPADAGPRLAQFHHLLEAYFKEWKKPAEYAAAMHITLKALSRLTSKYLSKTPSALIAERVVQEAKRALHFSHLSVKEIAAALGYDDPLYLSRLFRKQTGVSPREFRQQVGVVLLV
ncbi:AraC family transcriptional regulator [Chitinophaga pollutisoli]|uniref:AraC family transcriptional regulator n=1 Tax=Chitinophaga pollutisoli TaxID=3133966 RepID=A0ABZ2YK49_9BACT